MGLQAPTQGFPQTGQELDRGKKTLILTIETANLGDQFFGSARPHSLEDS